jgi:hypothetical protein
VSRVTSQRHPYATLAYARTLSHVGRPIDVPEWGTHVIARELGGERADAVGPYPLACLASDSDLASGLERLRRERMISVTLVVDALAGPPISSLRDAFLYSRPFKTHYLVDPSASQYLPTRHHRQEIRRAAKRGVEVRMVRLPEILNAWTALYDELKARHEITGVQRFSRDSFDLLARCDGLRTVAAFIGQQLVSCHLWFEHDGSVCSHLAASSATGYDSSAAYAVYDESIRHFSGRLIDLGGAAGTGDDPADGLARFKAGFCNRTHTAWLLGSVLDAESYQDLCTERGMASGTEYFPAYRAPPSIGFPETSPSAAA